MTRSTSRYAAFLLCLSASPALAQQADDASAPTNILFILVDDLGWADVTCNNPDTFYETPNIQALADSGMRFTQAYAACPVCSPTRASIMTGKYPARINTTDFFGGPQPKSILANENMRRFRKLPLLPANYESKLALEETTLAEAFGEAGYATYFAGKWHLGGDGFSPLEQGFDVNIAGHHRGGPYGRGRYFHPFDMPNLESEPGDHLPARLADETINFITAHQDEPFLAYLSFYSVHTPLMARDDLSEHYRTKKQDLGLEPEWGREGERKVRLVQEHAVYGGMVHAMDEAVGRVLGSLDELGIAERTLVVFFSDNGGLSTSEGHPTSNLPLRAGKGWLYEGGVREPCIVRWPGHTEPGSTSDLVITSTDFYPTLLEAVGLPLRPEQHLDGMSLAPVLTGEGEVERDAVFWHYPHWGNQGGSPGSAIRRGDWKLIEFFTDGRLELYNIKDDPGESRELSAGHPELAAQLHSQLQAWRVEVDARLPQPNPLYEEDD